jgi:glycosyltransferase involved in cell wall biosynthesis
MSARVLVVSNDHVGAKMAGPGIRYVEFARALAVEHDVTLVVPFATDLAVDGVRIVQDDPWDSRSMNRRVRGFDVVVAQKLPVLTMRHVARSSVLAIYDLYAPLTIESLAWARNRPTRRTAAAQRLNEITQEAVLRTGNAFLCASERQRDLWLGALLGVGRIDAASYAADPSLRELIDVVPFGIDPRPPTATGPAIKGVVPGIGAEDKLLLWGGGIWNWFDPLTVIDAVAHLARERGDVRLYFLGLRHPNPAVPTMEMATRAVAASERLGIRDRVVFFNEDWVPYDARGAYFLDADIGVSAHFDDLETRFAFRTRLLDCFWAQLPVITTEGDVLADLVREERLGRTIGVGDTQAWVAALSELLDDADEVAAMRERLEQVRRRLAWPEAVKPLRRLVASPKSAHALGLAATGRYATARATNAVAQHGFGALQRAARGALRRKKPLEERARPPRLR